MATEAGRHQLYEKISDEWGQEHAEELMSYLPPVGWADVATKQDLELLRAELRGEIAGLRTEIEKGFAGQLKWIIGLMVAMTTIFSFVTSHLH
jgi:hypothetical protein